MMVRKGIQGMEYNKRKERTIISIMDTIVLESKLHIPVQPQRIVPHPRLRAALDHQVAHYKLTLVSAPAGYGKTTLLAEWAHATNLAVVWLTVTGEEDDTESFLR